tara:strand:+ start:1589 stop:2074 length:486 start_codon:yes stop_codon:yes gene_type:complete
MTLQQRYDSLDRHGKKLFDYLRAMNGTRVTDYKKLTEKQMLDEVDKKMRVRDNQEEANRIFSKPRMLKWQEVLKKKKKPFKGYNKKIHARTGGLSAKGRAKFKREQGSNLKAPVTTKPSKLKRGSKAAKRRKSFCARSRGFKRDDGTYSEKAKAARRRWNC